VPSVLNLA